MAVPSGREVASGVREEESRRLAYVDGLRALAALYVVLTHVVLIAAPAHVPGHTEGRRPSWLPPGHFAVAVFMVLSGFCLALPIVRTDGKLIGGARAFYRRRARRILPPYYAALCFTLILIWTVVGVDTGTFWDYSVPVTVAGYVGNALLLQDFVGTWQVSVPFWSIAVEVQIYLLFPLLLLCWRRLGGRRTVVGAIVVSYLGMIGASALGRRGPLFFPGLTVYFVGLFTIGMAAAWLSSSTVPRLLEVRRRVPWTFLAGGFALCSAIVGYGPRANLDAATPLVELGVALSVACLLVGASRPERSRRFRAVVGARPLAFVGMFSYSLYLIHAPLLQATWQYGLRPFRFDRPATFVLLALIGVPLVLASAYAFFRLFEQPFMRRRRRPATQVPSRERAQLDHLPGVPVPAVLIGAAGPAANEVA